MMNDYKYMIGGVNSREGTGNHTGGVADSPARHLRVTPFNFFTSIPVEKWSKNRRILA